jgi:uncharacterized membrane protein
MIKKIQPALLISGIITVISVLMIANTINMDTDGKVVLIANLLLTAILVWNVWRYDRATNYKNPHAMVSGVMSGVVLKLFVLGGAAFIYLYASGEARNVNALFVSMALYIIYTWLEVRLVTNTKKSVDA